MCSLSISIQDTQEANGPKPGLKDDKDHMTRQVDGDRERASKRFIDGNGLIITCIAYSL